MIPVDERTHTLGSGRGSDVRVVLRRQGGYIAGPDGSRGWRRGRDVLGGERGVGGIVDGAIDVGFLRVGVIGGGIHREVALEALPTLCSI